MKSQAHLRFASIFAISLIAGSAAAQKQSPADKILAARALYYTPTTQGLKSFHCDVVFDWKDMLTRFSGSEVTEDNPFLKYLQSTHLSVSDDLNGGGQLEWVNSAAPPAGVEAPAAKLSGGMKQMISGFFTSWNVYMNGNMVPVPDATTTVTETPDGFQLHAASEAADVSESFDKNLLLTEAHVVQPTQDTVAYPTYIDTPDGRVISTIRSVYRQPPTAPPGELTFSITYAPVQAFRLPATLSLDMKNVGLFAFKFTGCSVQVVAKAPGKL